MEQLSEHEDTLDNNIDPNESVRQEVFSVLSLEERRDKKNKKNRKTNQRRNQLRKAHGKLVKR